MLSGCNKVGNNSKLQEFILGNQPVPSHIGARSGVVVKALHYKPAGRGFDSRWCHWNFSVT
jgi:hypothetical protein